MSEPIEPEVVGRRVQFTDNLNLMGSQLCVNCYPVQKYAIFTWGGHGLCAECFIPHRKAVDQMTGHNCVPGINKRDYVKTWGEQPITDAEVI